MAEQARKPIEKAHSPQHKTHSERNRHKPGIDKAQNIFGVSDLRQLLNKKRQEHDTENEVHASVEVNAREKQPDRAKASNPPPDPGYSYLRDPLRDNRQSKSKSPNKRGAKNSANKVISDAKIDLKRENLSNIKVELQVATGSRNCVIDDTSKIKPLIHSSEYPKKSQDGGRRGRGFRRAPNYRNRMPNKNNPNKYTDVKGNPTPRTESNVESLVDTNNEIVTDLEQQFKKSLVIKPSGTPAECNQQTSDQEAEPVLRKQSL